MESSFWAGDGAVPRLRRQQARVAVAARGPALAEIGKQLRAAAFHRFAQGEHGVQVGGETAAVCTVALGGVDQLALLHDVCEPVGKPGGRGEAVTSGTAGLLVIALDGLGQVEVGDEAHVGLVDAHAERDGGHHDDAVFAQEARLVRGAGTRVEPGVVGQRRDPAGHQEFRGLLHRRA